MTVERHGREHHDIDQSQTIHRRHRRARGREQRFRCRRLRRPSPRSSSSAAARAARRSRNTSPRIRRRHRRDAGRAAATQFTTCFHSNLYLGGFRDFESITHSYDELRQARRQACAPGGGRASTATRRPCGSPTARRCPTTGWWWRRASTSSSIPCRAIRKRRAESMPHAWKPGPQTQLLKRQLDALKDGAVIVMIAPPNPYRCPPGPYERVSMMAHVLKAKGHKKSQHHRPRSEAELLQAGAVRRRAGRSTIPAWSSGRTRRCTAASRASTPRP